MVTRVLEQVKVFDIVAKGTILMGMGICDEIPELVYTKEEIWESDEACAQALENAIIDWKICREENYWGTTSHKPELKIYWKTIKEFN